MNKIMLCCTALSLMFLALPLMTPVRAADRARNAQNPILWADVPDIAIIRVGKTYYMSSTTMHMCPGIPIMESKDLVNWRMASYAYDTLADNEALRLENGKDAYGAGSWASSLRFHNGVFYVSTFSATSGRTHFYTTRDPERGPWKETSFEPAIGDHSLFFDDDGRAYLVYGNARIEISELQPDLSGIKPDGVHKVLVENVNAVFGSDQGGLKGEGSQLFKINGHYYLFNIASPGSRWARTVIVHRADKIDGPYEGRIVLDDRGIAQGGLIDTPEGKWYAYLFKDNGAVGRIPYLVPVTWKDGWPVLGENGKAPMTLDIPAGGQGVSGVSGIVASDEFNRKPGDPALPLAWQWNHNPDNKLWSVTQRPGFLRLTTGRVDADLPSARNTLTQRTFGPSSSATTSIDVSGMKDGDYAGIAAFQKRYGFVGVKMSGGARSLVMVSADSDKPEEIASVPLSGNTVHLKVECEFEPAPELARFSYSLDGKSWTPIGRPSALKYTVPHFMGYRFALFYYSTKTAGGRVDFDYFRVGKATESVPAAPTASVQTMQLNGAAGGPRFDGIGLVNGGGATSVLLKDYPEPQRSQILDLVYKPKFGASVSALLVEIPGDGNSTQGSMPSHMHTRDDLNYTRGYTWWILREAKKRNPDLSLDGAAWSTPGWVGNGNFWTQDAADYYVKWLQGLRSVYGLEFDALGCRNEAGWNLDFAKQLRASLDANGFNKIKIHAFDLWWKDKFDFVKHLPDDEKARDAIAILGAHTLAKNPASAEVRELAAKMGKPIWNTEEHVYLKGFDCAISIVKAFNENFIHSGATRIVNWYDIAGVYPMEPYSEDPAAILAWSPWSGNYQVREALWGYAHYGQFTKIGWHYLESGCGPLDGGGTVVTFKSPTGDGYSIILETKGAKEPQQVRFQIGGGLPAKPLCVWRSDEKAQFVQQPAITPGGNAFTITLEPNAIYSLSTTTGQQKGSFANIPVAKPFPFPYYETFEQYTDPKMWGLLPRYTADITGAFELADRPDETGKCLRQVVPVRTISWAQPDWLPYTILGDDQWQDYEVGVDVCMNPGDSAGVMGRINHVGTGYGFTPKGYFLQLSADGECRLVVIRGKTDKNKITGDAEQQALIKAGKDEGEGGEKVLGTVHVPGIAPGQWHNLKLRFKGSSITGLVDDKPVLSVTDALYSRGMAGLLAGGGEEKKLSTPWFDNLLIKAVNAPAPKPTPLTPGQSPIYGAQDSRKGGGSYRRRR